LHNGIKVKESIQKKTWGQILSKEAPKVSSGFA